MTPMLLAPAPHRHTSRRSRGFDILYQVIC